MLRFLQWFYAMMSHAEPILFYQPITHLPGGVGPDGD